MAKETPIQSPNENAISIVGPGMRVIGDCETDGTLRIEGSVQGTVRAGKAVVIGKDGIVNGDVHTQDAIIGGRVNGSIIAESRLELQTTCIVEGDIRARRIKLDEGGRMNGTVQIGEVKAPPAPHRESSGAPRDAGLPRDTAAAAREPALQRPVAG
jgi:cytoskeletal protein CcmA (bactofilin family)